MTVKAGFIRVKCTHHQLRQTVRWLQSLPRAPATLLGGVADLAARDELEARLSLGLRHARTHLVLRREQVGTLRAEVEARIYLGLHVPIGISELLGACETNRVGAPGLTKKQLEQRVRDGEGDRRELRRLRRRLERHEQIERWLAKTREQGLTILTADQP